MRWRVRATRARALALEGITVESVVLAAALPLLFIHARYQPTIHVSAASTSIGIQLADFAVLAVVIAALIAGVRHGFAPLRRGRWLWLSVALYFVWVAVEILIPYGTGDYATAKHTVTAAKFLEYALLAPAVVLIVRRRVEAGLIVAVLTAWSALATAVGIAQFFGANIFVSGATGGRQLSFLGFHDFASLSTAVLLAGAAVIALPQLRIDTRVGAAALVSGAIGVVLSAALAAVVGIGAASIVLLVVLFRRREVIVRRVALVAVVIVAAVVGALGMRSTDLGRYLGLQHQHGPAGVESYSQRSLLTWIGWQMFRDHPVAGVGWEGSGEPSRFEQYIPAAKRHFPTQPAIAFPSPQHPWGVQNFYVQHLADLGAVGVALLAAVFVSALWLVVRRVQAERPLAAVLALVWILAVAGLWIAQGIVAGLPLDALTWLSFGLAAGV
jgi:O-antigen ligase